MELTDHLHIYCISVICVVIILLNVFGMVFAPMRSLEASDRSVTLPGYRTIGSSA
jgi:hypothetical protein